MGWAFWEEEQVVGREAETDFQRKFCLYCGEVGIERGRKCYSDLEMINILQKWCVNRELISEFECELCRMGRVLLRRKTPLHAIIMKAQASQIGSFHCKFINLRA